MLKTFRSKVTYYLNPYSVRELSFIYSILFAYEPWHCTRTRNRTQIPHTHPPITERTTIEHALRSGNAAAPSRSCRARTSVTSSVTSRRTRSRAASPRSCCTMRPVWPRCGWTNGASFTTQWVQVWPPPRRQRQNRTQRHRFFFSFFVVDFSHMCLVFFYAAIALILLCCLTSLLWYYILNCDWHVN